MAIGPIKPKNGGINVIAQNIRLAFSDAKRKLDTMTAVKGGGGGSNYAALAVWLGEANATDAQMVYDDVNQAVGYMTSANDAAANFDGSAM